MGKRAAPVRQTPTPPWAPYLKRRSGTVKGKIKGSGQQVKAEAGLEWRRLHLGVGAAPVKWVPLKVKGRGRAKAFREMALRLKTEAMLLEAAAAGEEDRERKLAALMKEQRMWRRAAKQARSSAAPELAGSSTLQ